MTKRKRIRKELLSHRTTGNTIEYELPPCFSPSDVTMSYVLSIPGQKDVMVVENLGTGKKSFRNERGQFTSQLKDADGWVFKMC